MYVSILRPSSRRGTHGLRPSVSLFRTRIRSLLDSQPLHGWSMFHSSYMVSHSLTRAIRLEDELKPLSNMTTTRYCSGEKSVSKYFRYFVLIYLQIPSSWDPDSSRSNTNLRRNMPTLISMLVTDLVLLVTMLIGLLHVRHHGAGRFALRRLVWKQVRWRQSLGSLVPANVISVWEGIIWLFAATAAELPPVVSSAGSLICLRPLLS
jgi:hypothetical protein